MNESTEKPSPEPTSASPALPTRSLPTPRPTGKEASLKSMRSSHVRS